MKLKNRLVVPGVIAALVSFGSGIGLMTSTSASATPTPVNIGLLTEQSGLLAPYVTEYLQGFFIGLDYATGGTDAVNGQPIDINGNSISASTPSADISTTQDDGDSASTAASDFKSDVGAGDKIIVGTADSAIADELAPLAAQNKVLYISGAAAADNVTGANVYTFRSGRQSYQDVAAAKSYIQALGKNKNIVILVQNYSFGLSYETDAGAAFKKLHDHVSDVAVSLTNPDYTTAAAQVASHHPDAVFLGWAGNTIVPMLLALQADNVVTPTGKVKVMTGLANIGAYGAFTYYFGNEAQYISLYVSQGSKNAPNTFLVSHSESDYGAPADLFSADGFVSAQMVVRALQKGGSTQDVPSMIKGLAGWSFVAPKGTETIRSSDHALLQPMYQVNLSPSNVVTVTKTLTESQTAPPVAAKFKYKFKS
jgi:branched-chain amino acid transport system substrate-binding protein